MDEVWGTEEDLYYVDSDDLIYSQRAVVYGLSPETLNEEELILIPGKLSIKKIDSNLINEELSLMKNKISEKECIVLDLNEIYGRDIFSQVNLLNLGLFSLRILKPGSFSFGAIITYSEDKTSYSYTNYNYRPTFSNKMKLDKKEKQELVKIINGVYDLDPKNSTHLRISFTRFSRYFSNRQMEDKLIDLCIAFEALFIKGEHKKTKLPMGKYIGNLCSNLIGEKIKDKKTIKTDIRIFWDMRNKVVHGAELKEYELWEVLPQFANYYRQSIKKKI